MARREKRKFEFVPTPLKQDLIGVILFAFALFILIANLTPSTGWLGFYVVKKGLRSVFGLGVFFLPVFLAGAGLMLLIRQEITALSLRFAGVLLLFLTFVTSAQMISPDYFGGKNPWLMGAGGVSGRLFASGLEQTVGRLGGVITLIALAVVSFLFFFNITIFGIFEVLAERWKQRKPKKKSVISTIPPVDTSIESQMSVIKDIDKSMGHEPPPKPEEVTIVAESSKTLLQSPKKKLRGYQLPPATLLMTATAQEQQRYESLRQQAEVRKQELEQALRSFGVAATVVNVSIGPAVTRFEVQPDPGVKVSKIAGLSDDIALNFAVQGVRIEAPVPGRPVVGIEVPNTSVTSVRLGDVVRTKEFQQHPSKLLIALGKDLAGNPILGDLSKMPHLLIAGTTGSGKSVCINSVITSLLMRCTPQDLKFLMIDPKMIELTTFNGLPHLLAPVVTDAKRASVTLREWVLREMERRFKMFFEVGVRNIDGFNQKIIREEGEDERLPYIVLIIDELADLMMAAAAEVESAICRLAQMARATGIHLVIATQRPSVDVITGLIKANIPSRIAFAVATQVDSRVIMDTAGAEKLLGRGDMLYHPVGAMKYARLQGSLVSDEEIERINKFIRDQATPEYLDEIVELKASEDEGATVVTGERDSLFGSAARLVVETGVASTSNLQRKFRIGYNRAARLMDDLEGAGIVSHPEGENKPRKILANWEELKSIGID